MRHTSQMVEKIKLEDKHYQKASKSSWEINAALHKCQISRDTLNGAHTAADDDDLVQLVMVTVYAMICIPILYMRVVLSQPQGKAMPIQERLVLVVSDTRWKITLHMVVSHFLSERKRRMLAPDAACFIVAQNGIQRNVLTDKEYLGGTCIGLCHNLIIPFIKRA